MNHREVMQQALEAIRIFREWETGQDYESCRATVLARALAAEESLGAALAEFDAEPTKEEQTQTESKQEPVACRAVMAVQRDKKGRPIAYWSGLTEARKDDTTRPQRQPLTEDEAWDMWEAVADRGKKGVHIVIDFARAIERAHGIGGQDE